MNIWLRPLMQSERSDEEAVSGRGAASCISVQGLAVCQHRGELLLYPLFYSSIYSQMFFFCFSIPLLSFLSWPVIFLCNLAVSLSQFSAQSFFFLLICVFVTCSATASLVNTTSGGIWVFSKKTLKKNWAEECVKSCTVGCGMCVYGYDCTRLGKRSCLCIGLHVHRGSGQTWGSSVTCMTTRVCGRHLRLPMSKLKPDYNYITTNNKLWITPTVNQC